jgi:hypothetical protein
VGRAKIMMAFGEYSFYSPDYKLFTKELSSLYQVNFTVRLNDCIIDGNEIEFKEEFYDYNYHDTLVLIVNQYKYDESKPMQGNHYNAYELEIPVDLSNEKELTIEFLPNGIFEIRYLPFSNLWRFFIEEIKGEHDCEWYPHSIIMDNIVQIRNCYIHILDRINCEKVIVWTDGDYETCDQYFCSQKPGRIHKLDDIISIMIKLDKFKIFNFVDSVLQRIEIPDDNKNYMNIAFLDEFEDRF